MGNFLIGVIVGWVIEWLLYQFWWKPKQPATTASSATDFSQERTRLNDRISDKDAEISHLKARIAILEDRGPASKSVKPAAPAKKAEAAKKPAPKKTTAKPKTVAKPKAAAKPNTATKPKAASKPKAAAKPKTAKTDDLKKVSGIGPKIAELLKADGIDSFAKLAKVDIAKIQGILKTAGPRYALADASSWSEQAQLLDEGKLDALEMLQASLKK